MWICSKSLPPSSFSFWRSGSHGHTQPPALQLHLSAVWSTQKSTPYLLCSLDTKCSSKQESWALTWPCSLYVEWLDCVLTHGWMQENSQQNEHLLSPRRVAGVPGSPCQGLRSSAAPLCRNPTNASCYMQNNENQLCHLKQLLANTFICSNPCHH